MFLLNRDEYSKILDRARGFLPHPVEYLMTTIDEDTIYILNTFICSIDKFI